MPLKPEEITVVVDTREQCPYDLAPMQSTTQGLATGDYSLVGLKEYVCVERKELGDLISCIGPGRERFKRELQRMGAYSGRCVVVEASWADLTSGNYKSRLNPESATNTIASWVGQYQVPFMMLGDRKGAQIFTGRFLFHAARRWVERAEKFRALALSKGA
jgi:DNA excision repair protein ERCC-4